MLLRWTSIGGNDTYRRRRAPLNAARFLRGRFITDQRLLLDGTGADLGRPRAYRQGNNRISGKSAIRPAGSDLMGQNGFSGRSGARRDVGHRASVATHPRSRFAPPKAGFFCALASLRKACDAPASLRIPRLARTQNNPGQTIPAGRIVL